MPNSIVIWGAGRIGRGFIADLFYAAGWRLVLVDQSAALIAALREAGGYTVVRAVGADRHETVDIAGYQALTTAQTDGVAAAVNEADLLAIAVFPTAFPAVTRALADALLARRAARPEAPLDMLLCTNLSHPGPQFRALLHDALPAAAQAYVEGQVGVVETLVIRIAPDPPAELYERDPLLVWTNGYPELPVDREAFVGPIPAVAGLRPVSDMRVEEQRKLYTYNTFHAALAYLGALYGYELIAECMADRSVQEEATAALDEAAHALQAEHGFPPEEMARWMEDVIRHTDNPALGDTVRRYGADPRRKLQREDRLVGPALLARAHGIRPTHLVEAIAAALRFDPPGDPSAAYVRETVKRLGVRTAVHELCGLTEDEHSLVMDIVRAYGCLPLEVGWHRRWAW
jgi:mannitol-1-phosphate 5-dehydrogenase